MTASGAWLSALTDIEGTGTGLLPVIPAERVISKSKYPRADPRESESSSWELELTDF